ncbi:mannonate dehydratase [Pseudorhizobium flavum]|uniref:mannonate dehydratase n=1 Tax=Pseudorhizobium flavum TaxID=1335061 RepID=UPI00376FCB0A
MQICMMIPPVPDRRWALARQMGVEAAIAKLAPELTNQSPPWDAESLHTSVGRYAEAGFKIVGLEGDQFDMSRIKLGLPGRDEDIELYAKMIRNMGREGISLLCLNFMAGIGWHRTRTDVLGRGGARVSSFDRTQPQELTSLGVIPSEDIWRNFEYFIRRVAPVAEDSGVRLGLHPDDPPVPELHGIGRVLNTIEALEKAVDIAASPSVGVTFCQGTIATMGEDVLAAARRFGRERIFFVHVRDVRASSGSFVETFPDEGQTPMAELFQVYSELGLECPIRPDHAPAMDGDGVTGDKVNGINVGYEAIGMVHSLGFLQGLMLATKLRT